MEILNHAYPNHHITLVKGLVKPQAFSNIREALATAPPDKARQLWIDCSHVNKIHLSSSSLCAFVSELLKIRNEQTQIVLCGMDKTTEKLFRLLKLDMLFEKAPAWDQALLHTEQELIAA